MDIQASRTLNILAVVPLNSQLEKQKNHSINADEEFYLPKRQRPMFVSSCLISLVLFFDRVHTLTNVGGVLLVNTVWSSNGNANPYYLIRDVQIPRNITLTIQSGVEVRFDKGDFEIFVKGYLKVQGTISRPVHFRNGSVNDTKWMINFQSTDLNQTSISGAIFTGPKRGLQMTNAAPGLQQNTGILVLQSVTFVNNATLATNGDCRGDSSACSTSASVELRSSVIDNSIVLNAGEYSESIRLLGSIVSNSIIIPRAAQQGIRFIDSILRNSTVLYDFNALSGSLEIISSNVSNIVVTIKQGYSSYTPCVLRFQRSNIRNASFLFIAQYSNYVPINFIFDDSTLNNILINGTSPNWWNSDYLYQYRAKVLIRNCVHNAGNIFLGQYGNSLDIRNSTFNQVNLIGATSAYYDNYYFMRNAMTMINTSFQNGLIKMSSATVMISRSTVSLLTPPLDMGRNSTISCSSIVRSPLIPQANTTGINATDLRLVNSSISQFQIGLRVNGTYLNTVSISNSNFESNTLYNIDNVGPYDVVATGNWWGTTSVSTIKAKITDYWDDIHLGEVLFANYSASRLLAERSCPRENGK